MENQKINVLIIKQKYMTLKLYNCSLEKKDIFGELFWGKKPENAINQLCHSYDIKLKERKQIQCEEVPEAINKTELLKIINK